jgi:hypothetical protein
MEVGVAELMVAVVPPNKTMLSAGVFPKPVPVIVTVDPTGATAGFTELITGAGSEIKVKPGLTAFPY